MLDQQTVLNACPERLSAGLAHGAGERVDVGAVVVGVKGHADAAASRADHDVALFSEAGLDCGCGERGMAQRDDVMARPGRVEISERRPAVRHRRGYEFARECFGMSGERRKADSGQQFNRGGEAGSRAVGDRREFEPSRVGCRTEENAGRFGARDRDGTSIMRLLVRFLGFLFAAGTVVFLVGVAAAVALDQGAPAAAAPLGKQPGGGGRSLDRSERFLSL